MTAVRLSPVVVGRALAAILIVVAVATNLAPDVVAVHTKAFGATPLGLPVTLVVSLVQAVLFAPLWWIMPHLMQLTMNRRGAGPAVTKLAILRAIFSADRTHRRSRNIVLAGFLYFVALMAAWIAFTEYRGL